MKILASIMMITLLSGCASLISGSRQTVTVLTPDVEGASCSLSDSKGRVWYIEETPGTALVKRGDGPISVICHKDGYSKGASMLKEVIAPANYGNLALGPAAPIGYVIDGFTGTGQKYKSSIEIYMEALTKKDPWETSYND